MLTKELIQADIDALPENYKTADIDRLISKYVKEKQDLSFLREHVLDEQQFHRIYYHGTLKQIRGAEARLKWIDGNLLFSDWWHTDELINFVKDADPNSALAYARRYVLDDDPFIRRWGYVMFISKLCRRREHLDDILSLLHNDEHYYVQMGEAWLLAELAVFFPDEVEAWIAQCDLKYDVIGKAIQKMCDSYRVPDKQRFKALRAERKALEQGSDA